jgi:beta-phosphoglucomutase
MSKAIIFDWDGTLANTKKAVIKSFQHVLMKSGCKINDRNIEKWVGVGTKNTLKNILQECNIKFNDAILDNLTEEKINIQLKLIKFVTIFEGAIELLDELKGKIQIALATMSSRKVVNRLLTEKGIREYFDAVFSADDVNYPKPNPEIFLLTAKTLKVDPKDCIVVEDSIFGIKAAKEAKMKCIAVSSGAYNKNDLKKEQPDMVVNSLIEKEKILDFIFC